VSSIDADVKRALEKAERARTTWAIEVTDFYSPPVVAEVKRTTKLWSDIVVQSWGGYEQAERSRLLFGREEIMLTAAEDSCTVAAVNVRTSSTFMNCTPYR
jgi:RNA-binding protein YlmH